MGEMSVDEYYKKFMQYVKYYPDDVLTEEKKMQRFELGSVNKVQVHIDSDRYTTLDAMYQRAAQVRCLIKMDKEKRRETSSVAAPSGKKRKENFIQQNNFHHSKRHQNFNDPHNGNGRHGKPQQGGATYRKMIKDRHGEEKGLLLRKVPTITRGKTSMGIWWNANIVAS